VEPVALDAVDGEAHPVHGDRALGGDEAAERLGRLDLQAPAAGIPGRRLPPGAGSTAANATTVPTPST